jgi:hypothetical protein
LQEHCSIIGKLLSGINRKQFKRLVDKFNGDRYVKYFNCWSQFVCIFIGQIGNLKSIREIVDTVNFQPQNQYHLGIKKNISRTTFAKANEQRDWRIYRDLFFKLIEKLPHWKQMQTENLVKILDSSPIRLDLINHPWAEKTQRIEGMKLHLIYDLTNAVPTYFEFSGARTNDVEVGKKTVIEKGCTYVFDKGYMNYSWWNDISNKGAYFVTRLKRNSAVIEESEIQIHNNIISSQLIRLKPNHHGKNRSCTIMLRRVFVQREGKSPLVLVTNDLNRSSEDIAELYKQRWQIELFFKWIKQNLKIKKFLGTSENAVKTQICIALISFILLHLRNELMEICSEISKKNLLKIIGNNMFYTLKPRKAGRKKYKDPNQLQFQWILE